MVNPGLSDPASAHLRRNPLQLLVRHTQRGARVPDGASCLGLLHAPLCLQPLNGGLELAALFPLALSPLRPLLRLLGQKVAVEEKVLVGALQRSQLRVLHIYIYIHTYTHIYV